jgi:peroxiredoxin
MRKGVFALCVAVALFWAGAPPQARALCLETGTPAPDFVLEDMDGQPVKLSDYRGKVVFLAFWASWCPRCMEELAFLQGLYTGLSKDLVVLAVNQETQNLSKTHVARIKEEVAGLGIQFPILLDKELTVWKSYCINALPTSVILDREGNVRFAEPNYYWASQKKFRAVLEELGVAVP